MLYNPLSTVSFFSKRDFRNYWFDRDTHAVRVWFNQIMAHIPYNDYINANASSVENADINYGEWLCRSMLLSYVRGAGIRAQAPGPRGIADMVARCGD
ncbi:MAG: hypothetical protein LBR38_01870 [Synergistaceae bacterium]|jgi:hypothetical protein|nr:hypothetical protein [Synergistaceae bacterium]